MYGPERRSRTRWCEQLVLLHHVLSLCFWVSVELLLLTFFLRHEEGKWLSLDTIANTNPAALWNYVRPFFQCGLVAQALVSVYALVASDPSCSRRLIAVERCIRVCTVYFVALPVVRDSVSLRSLLIPVSGWTLLNILRCLNTLYGSKGSFEWLSNKAFLLLYPLVAYEEISLVRSAARVLRTIPLAREFPSSMPNAYNFEVDAYVVYCVLPFLMFPCSVLAYCSKVDNDKLNDF